MIFFLFPMPQAPSHLLSPSHSRPFLLCLKPIPQSFKAIYSSWLHCRHRHSWLLDWVLSLPMPPVWVCVSEISSFFGLYGCGLSSISFSLWVCWGCGSGCVDLMGLPWVVENGGGCACNSSLGFVMVVEGQGGWVLWWWWKRKVVVADGAVVETVVAMADRGWLWLFFFFFF